MNLVYYLNEIILKQDKLQKKSNYLAYLLRLWREDKNTPWRVSIEDPHTGERRSFANLKALIAFLEEQAGVKLLD
jgi:hypothetical protein